MALNVNDFQGINFLGIQFNGEKKLKNLDLIQFMWVGSVHKRVGLLEGRAPRGKEGIWGIFI